MSGHKTAQEDSFALSYNPDQVLNGDQVYSLYLRAIKTAEGGEEDNGQSMIIPCAFNIQDFVKKVTGENNTDEVKFRVNYASAFGKDSASIVWKSSDVFTINPSGK